MIEVHWDPVWHLGPIPVNWYGLGWAEAFIVGAALAPRLVSPQQARLAVVRRVFRFPGRAVRWDVRVSVDDLPAVALASSHFPDINFLTHDAVNVVMLTGDSRETAEAVGRQLGRAQVHD